METLETIISFAILGIALIFAIVFFYEVYSDYSRLRNNMEEESLQLWNALYNHFRILHSNKSMNIFELHISELRDEWLYTKFISHEDKILLIRAGYGEPKKAKKALRKIGRDAIAAQAYLVSA
jgi:hypothetical protein